MKEETTCTSIMTNLHHQISEARRKVQGVREAGVHIRSGENTESLSKP